MIDVACHFCGMTMNPTSLGVFKRVTGWVENRKSGGAHALSLPGPPTAYACKPCMDVQRMGGERAQHDSLF